MDTNRYGVLAVTVIAVLVAAIAAVITRNSWADKDTAKSTSRSLIAGQTTTTFGAPSTTTRSSTTVALPLPSTSSTARAATASTVKSATVTTTGSGGTTVTTRAGSPSSTTSTTKGPTGTFDQRSDNDASFKYGPQPQDRDAGSQGPTSSKGTLTYIVRGQADSDSSWHLTADIRNPSGREARFDGGITAVIHLLCNSKAADVPLHDSTYTSMPGGGGGVILQADMNPVDAGPGTCTLYGTIHYSTV